MIVEVLVEIKAWKCDKTFSYHVPQALENKIELGKRVTVPFQNRSLEGFIIGFNEEAQYELKDIIDVVDEKPVLNEELLKLGKYIAKKTMSNLISSYQTMLPTALKVHKNKKINKKFLTYIVVNKENNDLTSKQKELYDFILKNKKVLKSSIEKKSILKTLVEKDILKEIKEEDFRLKENDEISRKENITLTDEQINALKELRSKLNTFSPFLLHGVTGSGKTLIYIEIISEVLKEGKEAIVLVPEISLTPQLVNKFKARFKDNIAVLHSALSDGEKYDEWRKIEEKKVKIAIGARSCIFAPFTNLGLIVVDEEHTETYKQENNPKYTAIDLALWRCKYHKCELILGSATPSVESYVRAYQKIYKLIELKKRVNNNLPKTYIIDMKEEIKKGFKIFSKELIEAINLRLDKKEQVLILLNRRGYATNITCHNCGFTIKCKACDIPLVYHKSSNMMRCHYCGYAAKLIHECPNCKEKDMNYFGLGTQKLEEEINKLFKARVVRMDVDTTVKKGAHAKIIKDFLEQKYDILVGTQMISKGLDFPNVTLVGVINGDASLNIPDFRSGERTFALLNQIAGRSGRSDKKGEVYFQVFNKEHYSIIYAANNDYNSYIKEELKHRKILNYPPYYNLLVIKISGKNEDEVINESNKINIYLKKNLEKTVFILGPSPALMSKVNNKFFYQIILKYKNDFEIRDSIVYIKNKYNLSKTVLVDIDFNPLKI